MHIIANFSIKMYKILSLLQFTINKMIMPASFEVIKNIAVTRQKFQSKHERGNTNLKDCVSTC